MIYKWNEINLDMFLEIFDSFWNGEDWSKELVMEIQNIPAILSNQGDSRVYFSRKINIYDFKEDNESTINFLESAKEVLNGDDKYPIDTKEILHKNSNLSMSILLDDGLIRVLPFSISSYDVIRHCFGLYVKGESSLMSYVADLMNFWYLKSKDTGKRKVDITKNSVKKYDNNEKIIRVRTMDYDDWRSIINTYKDTKIIRNTEDDLKKEDFEVIDK